jgi:hypothetical protein
MEKFLLPIETCVSIKRRFLHTDEEKGSSKVHHNFREVEKILLSIIENLCWYG